MRCLHVHASRASSYNSTTVVYVPFSQRRRASRCGEAFIQGLQLLSGTDAPPPVVARAAAVLLCTWMCCGHVHVSTPRHQELHSFMMDEDWTQPRRPQAAETVQLHTGAGRRLHRLAGGASGAPPKMKACCDTNAQLPFSVTRLPWTWSVRPSKPYSIAVLPLPVAPTIITSSPRCAVKFTADSTGMRPGPHVTSPTKRAATVPPAGRCAAGSLPCSGQDRNSCMRRGGQCGRRHTACTRRSWYLLYNTSCTSLMRRDPQPVKPDFVISRDMGLSWSGASSDALAAPFTEEPPRHRERLNENAACMCG